MAGNQNAKFLLTHTPTPMFLNGWKFLNRFNLRQSITKWFMSHFEIEMLDCLKYEKNEDLIVSKYQMWHYDFILIIASSWY